MLEETAGIPARKAGKSSGIAKVNVRSPAPSPVILWFSIHSQKSKLLVYSGSIGMAMTLVVAIGKFALPLEGSHGWLVPRKI